MARNEQNPNDETDRDHYRDNDDMRNPLEGDALTGGNADTRGQARGDARENVGNNAHGTDTDERGPEWNDKTRHRPRPDSFDADLERDNERRR